MVDFHSHILPGIDDGSQSAEESVSLLKMLSAQGVDVVAATPHFDASRCSVEAFLEKRTKTYRELLQYKPENGPEIRLGAEVFYYTGISRLPELPSLCLEGTRLLLLEMPYAKWGKYILRELEELSCRSDFTVLLAHVERYFSFQSSDVWSRLRDNGVLMQVNARFFHEFRTRRKALRMLKHKEVHLLGSDCHNLTRRPPRMEEAAKVIRKKFGEAFLKSLFLTKRVSSFVSNTI